MFEIRTKNLILRDLKGDDWKIMWGLGSDPTVTKYMADYIKYKNEGEAKKWVREMVNYNSQTPRESYNLAIVERLSKKMIGWIGIGEPSNKTIGDLDFGYALLPKFWGKGYASEALKELLNFCFEHMPIKKIVGQCDIRNKPSARVMEKAGMVLEKEVAEDGIKSYRYKIQS